MTKLNRLRALSLAALLVTVSAQADDLKPQHYWVRIPQSSKSCADEATALGAQFAQVTKLTVSQAKCTGTVSLQADGQTYSLYAIDVTYMAAYGVSPYTAMFGTSSVFVDAPSDSDGAYPTMQNCLDDIQNQNDLFTKQTGLAALAGRCEPGSDVYQTAYVLKIDSFGTPAQTLQLMRLDDFHGTETAPLIADVQNLIQSSGGTMAGNFAGDIFYYASSGLPVHVDMLDMFTVPSECSAQLDEVRAIYLKAGATSVTAACVPVMDSSLMKIDGTKDDFVRIVVIHNATDSVSGDNGAISVRYYSFAECMADKDRVIQDLVSSGDTAPAGAVCIETEVDAANDYVLELYGVRPF